MKKELKGFIIGVVTTLILTGGAFAANSIIAELYPDNVSIYSNGYRVIESNFTYNDKTYAPIREVAEMADCVVGYEDDTKEVNVYNRYFEDGTKLIINGTSIDSEPLWYFKKTNDGLKAYFIDEHLQQAGITVELNEKEDTFFLTNPYLYACMDNGLVDENFNIIGKAAGAPSSPTQSISTSFPLHLYSNDGKVYLGKLVTSAYDTDGIWNTYGTYGSKYQTKSIWNDYGTYGGKYSSESAFNDLATKPPKIVDNNGKLVGYLTTNRVKANGFTIEELYHYLKNNNQ